MNGDSGDGSVSPPSFSAQPATDFSEEVQLTHCVDLLIGVFFLHPAYARGLVLSARMYRW